MKVQTTKNDPINRGEEGRSELKLRIISTWLGWRDSNPRMLGPEPSALPLGDTPLVLRNCTTLELLAQGVGALLL